MNKIITEDLGDIISSDRERNMVVKLINAYGKGIPRELDDSDIGFVFNRSTGEVFMRDGVGSKFVEDKGELAQWREFSGVSGTIHTIVDEFMKNPACVDAEEYDDLLTALDEEYENREITEYEIDGVKSLMEDADNYNDDEEGV